MTAEDHRSRIPAPTPVTLPAARTAVLVLDLTAHGEPSPARQKYLERLGDFLDRARLGGVVLCFTGISIRPEEPVEEQLHRREDEPLFLPPAYDKFYGGEIARFLDDHDVTNVVITGAATNVAVMYTASAAVRHHHFTPYVPIDGAFVEDPYRHEYALYQLSVLPSPPRPVVFTMLEGLAFF